LSVRLKEGEQDPMRPIITGYWVSSLSALRGSPGQRPLPAGSAHGTDRLALTVVSGIGILLAMLTLWLTNYYTHRTAARSAKQPLPPKPGRRRSLLSGMRIGNESTVVGIMLTAAPS